MLDERLLNEATQVLGARTYSAAVNTALAEVIRMRKLQSIPRYFNSSIWDGNLGHMRDDQPPRKRQHR